MKTIISSIRLFLFNSFAIIIFNYFLGNSFIISSKLSFDTVTTLICLFVITISYYFTIKKYKPEKIYFGVLVKSILIKLLFLLLLIVWEILFSLYIFSGHTINVTTIIFLFVILIAFIILNIYFINKFPFP